MIDVTIIIISYNKFRYTDVCLETLKKFTQGLNYEIIVIDNNSSEDINFISHKYPEVVLIKNKSNRGFAAANNQGVNIANGEYILFLNNDTIFTENTIKKVFDFVESQSNSLFVGCRLLNTNGSYQESVMDFPSVWNIFTDSFFLSKLFKKNKFFNKNAVSFDSTNKITEVDVIKGAFMFCRTDSIRKLNGFDERFYFYSEELDLCKRFKNKGGKVIYYPETSIIHIGGATVKGDQLFFYKNQAIARIQYFQKHFSGSKFFLAIFFYYLGIIIRIPIYFIIGIVTVNSSYLSKSKHYFRQLFYYPKNVFK